MLFISRFFLSRYLLHCLFILSLLLDGQTGFRSARATTFDDNPIDNHGSSTATSSTPFLTRNQSPFSLIYGLPLASSARLIETHTTRWISSANISNTVNKQSDNTDNLLLDIETWQLNLLYDTGFKDNWMLRIQLPYIVHSGGFLDSSIESYHQALGLPNHIRGDFLQDQLDVNFTQNGITQLTLDSRQQSPGDLSLQIAWQAQQSDKKNISYWASLKLPTGDASKLTGSDATDIAGWVSLDYAPDNAYWFYGQAGLLYMNGSKVLENLHNNWAGFANAGLQFKLWGALDLKTQLDMHTALYDSDIEFLGPVIQLTFGASYHLSKQHQIDFAIAEDIKNNASPDVNFNISWWIHY